MRTAGVEAAMEQDQRDGEDTEPEMRLEPELDVADGPEALLFPNAERGGEEEDEKGDGAEDEAQRSASVGVAGRRDLAKKPGRGTEMGRSRGW